MRRLGRGVATAAVIAPCLMAIGGAFKPGDPA